MNNLLEKQNCSSSLILIEMPLVTVIIPNFNHAPYLVKRIESILNHEFIDIGLILLDDCSNDNSRAIMTQYAA
ncbi:hypothetical protein GCM10027511_28420 [Hymenobacter humi]